MRNVYQKRKWRLFKKIEESPIGSAIRTKLLAKFNDDLPQHKDSEMYEGCRHGMFQSCPDCYDSTEE